MNDEISRRDFLKKTAVGASAAATATLGTGCTKLRSEGPGQENLAAEKKWGRGAGQWIPSCCNMCGGQSGIMCHVVDGKLTKIEPNHWNPNNYCSVSTTPAGDGFFDGYSEKTGTREGCVICPKGNAGIMQLYDPDRVKGPLKRTNPRKGDNEDPRWQQISWEQAIDEIAAKLAVMRNAGDAHKLLWWSEDTSFTHIQDDFCKLYGSPNYSMHSNLCDVARKASFKITMGDDRPLSDFIQAKYILLFGWNPLSAIKWVYLPRCIMRGIERGAHMVVVDPYMSDTAVKAHEWVPIRPGTDGAMALAMAHVIIREALYDKEFVENWTAGFAEFSDYVKDKTPEWADKITSVPAINIERIAREFATTKPAVVDAWSGPSHHSNGVQSARAITLLAALVGGYDRPGTLMIADKRGEKQMDIESDEMAKTTFKQPRFDGLEDYPFGHKSGVYGRGFQRLLESTGPYQPKIGICIFQNLVMSGPGGSKVADALAKLELFVVVDTMMSETAWLADYVIPGTTYLERYDLISHWVTWPVLGIRQPVVKPIFGQLAEYEFVTALGRKIGLKTADGSDFFNAGPLSKQPIEELTAWYEDYLSNELRNGAPKMTLEELKRLPGAVWVDKEGTKYEKFKAPISAEKLVSAFVDGDIATEGTAIYDKPKDKGGKRIGTVIGGNPVRGFFTPSGKIEFCNAGFAKKKDANGQPVDSLPVYKPRDWQPTEEFPFYLINWKEASHTHTRTQNNGWLLELKPSNPLVIARVTAESLGIRDGAEVWVESKFGKARAQAKVNDRIHPAVVGAQHGFGHRKLGKLASGRGTNFGDLNFMAAFDPLSGQGMHKEICVKVYKA